MDIKTLDKKIYLMEKLNANLHKQLEILNQVKETKCWYSFENGISMDLHRPLISLQWSEKDLRNSLSKLK